MDALIYTVTLNPAVDKILFVDEFQLSKTNRVQRTIETVGGKGTHVSINLKLLGVESVALGVTFGETGKKITRMLNQYSVINNFLHFDTAGCESRTNVEIVESSSHVCTMISERGPVLPTKITDALLEQIRKLVISDDFLVLTGDASNVEDISIYSKLIREAKNLGAKIILDASGSYLAEGIKSTPFLIKPNFEEMSFLMGKEITSENELTSAIKVLANSGIEIIAMTWGGKGAIVKNGDTFYRVNPVTVNALNEAGCGDAFLAALLAGLVKKDDFIDTLKNATAVAGATAESEMTVGFDMERVEQLRNQAIVTEIN
jgi:1-phosphofructokinase family hexose kinase